MRAFLESQRALVTAGIFVAAFFATLTVGRLLKRRAGVQLGLLFQLFCLTLAFYAAICFYGVDATWRTHSGAVVALLSTAFVIALLDRYLWDFYFEKRRQTPIPHLLREVVALVVFLVALLLVLAFAYHAQAQLKGLLAGSGVAAVILGFAGQNLFGGIIAGIALQINRPFKVGDWLHVQDRYGEVMEINWRSTRLRTNDAVYLDIPNNEIVKQTIVNLHYPTQVHAMRLRIGADYSAAPNKVKDALQRAALNAEGVLADPKPKVFLMVFGDSAVLYEIKFWMGNHAAYNDITDAIRTNIWYEFRRQAITIPFPIRTLQVQRKAADSAAAARDEARGILRNEPLFGCLPDEQLNRLVDAGHLSRFGRGERILGEGDEGDSMFVLLRGSAQVSMGRNGTNIRLRVMHAGDVFGEIAMLTGERRSATVRAEHDCEVLEISKQAMAELFREAPECLNQLSDLLAQRQLETEDILKDATPSKDQQKKEREYRATFLSRIKAVFEL